LVRQTNTETHTTTTERWIQHTTQSNGNESKHNNINNNSIFTVIIFTFTGFGSQEGWITTDIKTYMGIVKTNSKTLSTHQLLDESQSATEFNAASPVQSVNQIG